MTREPDRMARAGHYVLGLMDDADRERAERDLEVDQDFRDAVIRIAERMHLFDITPRETASDGWRTIATRIAEMPQMRPAFEALEGEWPGPANLARPTRVVAAVAPFATPSSRRAAIVVGGLIAAFVAGYLAAVLGGGWPF